MPLEEPKVDDRAYADILAEALARIRVHNPEWTNFNESDPGVTILELFAFMTESLLYRANQIPERNRRKFLSLLGIPLQPGTAARGFVTFRRERGPLAVDTLTPAQEALAGKVPFRTETGLDVLPVEILVCYKQKADPSASLRNLYEHYYRAGQPDGANPVFYKTAFLEPPVDVAHIPTVDLTCDTVDRCLWVAVLARPKDENLREVRQHIGGRTLSLGILPAMDETARRLPPAREPAAVKRPALDFRIARAAPGESEPRYDPPPRLTMSADVLTEPGIVQLTLPDAPKLELWPAPDVLRQGTGELPPLLEEADDRRVLTWIRIAPAGESGFRARISWIGANAALVTQRAHVTGELLGRGRGEPDQSFVLINRPVLPGSLRLTVDGVLWRETDDLLAAGPEVAVPDRRLPPGSAAPPGQEARVYTLDPESGTVRFGDGARGTRPPTGSPIVADYDFGGGRAGNIGIGAINQGPELPMGLKVGNPLPTWGGDDPETVADAERNIARQVRHRDRLVTVEDWEEIVLRTPGVDMGRVEILPLVDPDEPDLLTPGAVTVLVIPQGETRGAPVPDRLFLEQVCRHVDPRRLVTTEVHVRGPSYKEIYVSAGIEVVPGRDFPPVREAVNAALRRFLSPLTGGREQSGWLLSRSVAAKELWAEASRVDGVAYVRDLWLGLAEGGPMDEVRLSGLELPWLARVETREGDPEALETLQGTGEAVRPASPSTPVTPVPVVPPECKG